MEVDSLWLPIAANAKKHLETTGSGHRIAGAILLAAVASKRTLLRVQQLTLTRQLDPESRLQNPETAAVAGPGPVLCVSTVTTACCSATDEILASVWPGPWRCPHKPGLKGLTEWTQELQPAL